MTAALALVFTPEDDTRLPDRFRFSELPDRAKQSARDLHREHAIDYDWWDSVYDDAATIAEMMGIDIDRKPIATCGGKTRYEPAIYFSGFGSQGDGAMFEGDWSPVQDPLTSLTDVMNHAPQDEKLHEIALDMAALSERCAIKPDVTVRIRQGGSRYCHSGTAYIDYDSPEPDGVEEWDMVRLAAYNAAIFARRLDYEKFSDDVAGVLRRFMDWIYGQLQAEYEWRTSDERIDEDLADRWFNEDGEEL